MNTTKQSIPSSNEADFWLDHLKAWKSTGKSMTLYARKHGLNPDSFYYWKKKLRLKGIWDDERQSKPDSKNKSRRPSFKRVSVIPSDNNQTALDMSCQITLPNGVVISLSGSLPSTTLTSMLETAGRLS